MPLRDYSPQTRPRYPAGVPGVASKCRRIPSKAIGFGVNFNVYQLLMCTNLEAY